MEEKKEWFGEWFDSPYYHVLYKDRDYTEARNFIDHLIDHLHLNPSHKILDLACGKGRHSIYLNSKKMNVVGLDLSESNIKYANQFSNECLKFFQHDMRLLYSNNEFDFVLNMFTSFGYFKSTNENQIAIDNMAATLKPKGKLVLDFLNPYKVIHYLTPEEVVIKEGIEFHITKEVDEQDYIIKTIRFNADGTDHTFYEKVKAIRKAEFLDYFKNAQLSLVSIFGDYELNPYDCDVSERMIFIVEK